MLGLKAFLGRHARTSAKSLELITLLLLQLITPDHPKNRSKTIRIGRVEGTTLLRRSVLFGSNAHKFEFLQVRRLMFIISS